MSRAPAENTARYLDAAALARANSIWEIQYTSTHFPRLGEVVSDVPQISAQLRFEPWSGHASIQGHVSGSVELICQRCLKPMRYSLEEPFALVLIGAEEEAVVVPDSYDAVVLDAARLDVQWLVEEQLLLALPLIPKHEDEAECDARALASPKPVSRDVEHHGKKVAEDRQRPFQNLRELLRKS